MNPYTTFAKPVDVLTNQGWKPFDTIKEASVFIGCSNTHLTVCLRKDKPCNGYQVRLHETNL